MMPLPLVPRGPTYPIKVSVTTRSQTILSGAAIYNQPETQYTVRKRVLRLVSSGLMRRLDTGMIRANH
jgi:hypothetical protein